MLEFGKTLREAREAKGLTIAEIANQTHIMSSMVSDLENEVFTRLAAPIYGRGFIKLYCECVGLDPKPLIAEFMDIYNGNREPMIRERVQKAGDDERKESPAEPIAAPEPPDVSDSILSTCAAPEEVVASEPPQPSLGEQLDLFSAPHVIPPSPKSAVVPAEPAPPFASEPPIPPADGAGTRLSRYAMPLKEQTVGFTRAAPAIGRWCVVAAALAIVFLGIAFGIRALYRATNEKTAPEPAELVRTAETPKRPAEAPRTTPPKSPTVRTSRTPIDIPPLYID